MPEVFGRRFVGQALSIYVLQALGLIAALLTSVLLARHLGAEGKGSVDLFLLLVTLIGEIGMLGLTYGFIYLLANRKKPLAEMHGDALVAAAVLGVAGLFLALLVPDAIAGLLGNIEPTHVALGLAIAGFIGYSAAWSGLMFGTDRAPMTYRVQALVSIGTALFVAGLVFVDRLSTQTAILVIAGLAVAAAVLRFVVARRQHPESRPRPTRQSLAAALGYGLRVLPGRVANWLHFRVDMLIVSHAVGLVGVGVYAVSVRWAELLWLVGLGVQSAGIFRVASGSPADSRAFTKRLFVLVLALTGIAGVALALLADPLLSFLYGPEFEAAIVPLLLLIPGVVAWDASRVLSNYISLNLGRPGLVTIVAIVGAIVNIAATVVAVERWGMNGAALATSITYVGVVAVIFVLFLRLPRPATEPSEVQA